MSEFKRLTKEEFDAWSWHLEGCIAMRRHVEAAYAELDRLEKHLKECQQMLMESHAMINRIIGG